MNNKKYAFFKKNVFPSECFEIKLKVSGVVRPQVAKSPF